MIKFRTESTSHLVTARITEVEIERETESSIWVKGRQLNKVTTWDIHWDSWDEAHAHLKAEAMRHYANAQRRMDEASRKLDDVTGMKKPVGA